nr:hypothetical protein [Ktedonobacteraceae bacterium]
MADLGPSEGVGTGSGKPDVVTYSQMTPIWQKRGKIGSVTMEGGQTAFWDGGNLKKSIVIRLTHESYSMFVLKVKDPEETVARVERAVGKQSPTAFHSAAEEETRARIERAVSNLNAPNATLKTKDFDFTSLLGNAPLRPKVPFAAIFSQTSSLHLRMMAESPIDELNTRFGDFDSPLLWIILDDKEVGVIRMGDHPTVEIQAGHHTIFLRTVYKFISSPHLTFDSAPSEEVTFFYQVFVPAWGGHQIKLWRPHEKRYNL